MVRASLSALKVCNAMNWPGGASISFYVLIILVETFCTGAISQCKPGNRFLTISNIMMRNHNEWEWNIQLRYCCRNRRCNSCLNISICCNRTHLLWQIKPPKEPLRAVHEITTAINVSEVEACVRFNVSVHMVRLRQRNQILYYSYIPLCTDFTCTIG